MSEHFYVRGSNAAVTKARWDPKKYMALYSYFLERTRRESVRRAMSSRNTALCMVEYCLLKAMMSYLNINSIEKTKFYAKEVDKFKKSLTAWDVE